MSCFNERVVVVLGLYIESGRSGTEAVKRIIRYISCSGRGVAFVMLKVEGSCGEARRCREPLFRSAVSKESTLAILHYDGSTELSLLLTFHGGVVGVPGGSCCG
jgi:hypothetical protein